MARAHLGLTRGAAVLTAAAATAVLYACASPGTASRPAASARTAGATSPPAPGRDWHVLAIAPFGTLLKDVPFRLAEIVVFHDSAEAGHEDRDCYTLQGAPPPALLGRQVDEYSLCFSSDRLTRIEASVRLPAESASAEFAAACAEWQRRGTPVIAAPDRCGEREGSTEVEARLTAAETSGEPTLSISLTGSATALRDPGP